MPKFVIEREIVGAGKLPKVNSCSPKALAEFDCHRHKFHLLQPEIKCCVDRLSRQQKRTS
jgi:hypothetical protein